VAEEKPSSCCGPYVFIDILYVWS